VNKKGFISIYGLILLSLCLGFTSMLLVKTKSLKVKNEQLAYAELYAIQQVKNTFQEVEEIVEVEEETEENFEEEIEDDFEDEEENITNDEEEESIYPQTFFYKHYEIHITYEMNRYILQIYEGNERRIYSQLKVNENGDKIIDYIYL